MADSRVTALTENTAPVGTDLLYIVDDPAGSPLGQKVTITNLLNTVERYFTLTVPGTLAVAAGAIRIPNLTGRTLTISKVSLVVNSLPTGAAIIVDVNENGSTIFASQDNRPQVVASTNEGSSVLITDASWADGNYLQADVDQIGSSQEGSDLTVTVIAN